MPVMSRLIVFVFFNVTWDGPQSLVVSTHPPYLIAKEVTGWHEPVLLLYDQTGHDVQLTPLIVRRFKMLRWYYG